MRSTDFSRRLMRENELTVNDLIYPMFIIEGGGRRDPVGSMPDIERLTVDELVRDCAELVELRVPAVALFPMIEPAVKTLDGREAWNEDGLVPRAVRAVKARFPELGVITDAALDPYTSHGQDGVIDAAGYVKLLGVFNFFKIGIDDVFLLERQQDIFWWNGVVARHLHLRLRDDIARVQ